MANSISGQHRLESDRGHSLTDWTIVLTGGDSAPRVGLFRERVENKNLVFVGSSLL